MFLAMEWAVRRSKPCLIFTASRLSIWPTTTSKKYRRYGSTASCCYCYSHITSLLKSTSCQPSLIHAVTINRSDAHSPSVVETMRGILQKSSEDTPNVLRVVPYSSTVLPHRPIQHLPATIHACYLRKDSLPLHHHLCFPSMLTAELPPLSMFQACG